MSNSVAVRLSWGSDGFHTRESVVELLRDRGFSVEEIPPSTLLPPAPASHTPEEEYVLALIRGKDITIEAQRDGAASITVAGKR